MSGCKTCGATIEHKMRHARWHIAHNEPPGVHMRCEGMRQCSDALPGFEKALHRCSLEFGHGGEHDTRCKGGKHSGRPHEAYVDEEPNFVGMGGVIQDERSER